MKTLILKTALSPLWLAGRIIEPIGRERIQGAILGALALTALTGYIRAEDNASRVPMPPEFVQAMIDAGEYQGTIWDEPQDLAPLDSFEDEEPPIPSRKPEFGYTAQDRAEMDNIFAQAQ